MNEQPHGTGLHDALLGDAEIAALVDDRATLRAMLRVEAALARAQGRLETIPAAAGDAIGRAADGLDPAPTSLAAATARDGVAVPGLVRALEQAVGAPHADHVHFGATSQDIVDTAFVLTSSAALDALDARLALIVARLAALAEAHADTVMAGRTRFQLATPTTFGLKAAGWALPLHRHRLRLAQMRPRLAVVSLAGASGNLAALGSAGPAVEAALAASLGLAVAPGSWHAARDAIVELGTWLSLVTGALGKIGLDLLLLAQSEVAELRPGGGGGSSTMPHKHNPVGAEALVALARANAERVATLHHALLHAHERDGTAWMSEWMVAPAMFIAAGAATRRALALLDGLAVDVEAMRARVTQPPGLALSEPAVFALAATMPRGAAARLVAEAATTAVASTRALVDVLEERLGGVIDWAALRRLDTVRTASAARMHAILEELRRPARADGTA